MHLRLDAPQDCPALLKSKERVTEVVVLGTVETKEVRLSLDLPASVDHLVCQYSSTSISKLHLDCPNLSAVRHVHFVSDSIVLESITLPKWLELQGLHLQYSGTATTAPPLPHIHVGSIEQISVDGYSSKGGLLQVFSKDQNDFICLVHKDGGVIGEPLAFFSGLQLVFCLFFPQFFL